MASIFITGVLKSLVENKKEVRKLQKKRVFSLFKKSFTKRNDT